MLRPCSTNMAVSIIHVSHVLSLLATPTPRLPNCSQKYIGISCWRYSIIITVHIQHISTLVIILIEVFLTCWSHWHLKLEVFEHALIRIPIMGKKFTLGTLKSKLT